MQLIKMIEKIRTFIFCNNARVEQNVLNHREISYRGAIEARAVYNNQAISYEQFISPWQPLKTTGSKSAAFVRFFLGGELVQSSSTLFQWYPFSHARPRIGRELVRLITLICLNKFSTNIIFPKTLKKFSRTTFRWWAMRKRSFLVFQMLL